MTTHKNSHVGRSTHTGNDDQGLLYQSPSTLKRPSEAFFKYQSSVSSHELVNQAGQTQKNRITNSGSIFRNVIVNVK